MSMAVKSGYVNPLSTVGRKMPEMAQTAHTQQNAGKTDDVKELQAQQQALQNTIMLMKTTSDGAGATADSQKALQENLEQVSTELKTAKTPGGADHKHTAETGGRRYI